MHERMEWIGESLLVDVTILFPMDQVDKKVYYRPLTITATSQSDSVVVVGFLNYLAKANSK